MAVESVIIHEDDFLSAGEDYQRFPEHLLVQCNTILFLDCLTADSKHVLNVRELGIRMRLQTMQVPEAIVS